MIDSASVTSVVFFGDFARYPSDLWRNDSRASRELAEGLEEEALPREGSAAVNRHRSVVQVVPKTPEGVTGWIESAVITTAKSSVGQSLLKLIDSFLWVVEKSAQWSLPAHEINAEENGKMFGKVELVRPLPWVLFLPGLVILRIIRTGLNVGALILGYPRIQPSGMVKFMQRSRRRLRTMNLKAIKSSRRRASKDKRLTMIEAKKALIKSIKLTLSTLSCLDTSKSSPSPPPTKIRISGMDLETAITPDEKSATESAESSNQMEAKRKFSQVSSGEGSSDELENETLQSRIDRLAREYNSDDTDFNPAECSMQSSTSSEDEAELNVSSNELNDLRREAKDLFCNDSNQKPTIFPIDENTRTTDLGTIAADFECASPESQMQTVSKQTSDFISGEVESAANSTPAAVPLTQEASNGVVAQKRKTQKSGAWKPRASRPKESSSAAQEKKSVARKKAARNDAK
ncbi:uncharacterized protein LOC143376581 [Andrena cerasifolii]|uniref:uncharacterized protein LOC143376581 n=1 Tax=Andrena cerasifolii TaxID=2819439 RepID=UPI0040382E37